MNLKDGDWIWKQCICCCWCSLQTICQPTLLNFPNCLGLGPETLHYYQDSLHPLLSLSSMLIHLKKKKILVKKRFFLGYFFFKNYLLNNTIRCSITHLKQNQKTPLSNLLSSSKYCPFFKTPPRDVCICCLQLSFFPHSLFNSSFSAILIFVNNL